MRVTRLLLAGAAMAGSFAVTAPVQAQPCVQTYVLPVDIENDVSACVLPDPSYRGASLVVVYVGYVVAGEGCYHPGGQPRYYLHVASAWTPSQLVILPVGGVPCV